jgi:hypothetical protein
VHPVRREDAKAMPISKKFGGHYFVVRQALSRTQETQAPELSRYRWPSRQRLSARRERSRAQVRHRCTISLNASASCSGQSVNPRSNPSFKCASKCSRYLKKYRHNLP